MPLCTTMSVKAWKKVNSPKHVRTWRPWRNLAFRVTSLVRMIMLVMVMMVTMMLMLMLILMMMMMMMS